MRFSQTLGELSELHAKCVRTMADRAREAMDLLTLERAQSRALRQEIERLRRELAAVRAENKRLRQASGAETPAATAAVAAAVDDRLYALEQEDVRAAARPKVYSQRTARDYWGASDEYTPGQPLKKTRRDLRGVSERRTNYREPAYNGAGIIPVFVHKERVCVLLYSTRNINAGLRNTTLQDFGGAPMPDDDGDEAVTASRSAARMTRNLLSVPAAHLRTCPRLFNSSFKYSLYLVQFVEPLVFPLEEHFVPVPVSDLSRNPYWQLLDERISTTFNFEAVLQNEVLELKNRLIDLKSAQKRQQQQQQMEKDPFEETGGTGSVVLDATFGTREVAPARARGRARAESTSATALGSAPTAAAPAVAESLWKAP